MTWYEKLVQHFTINTQTYFRPILTGDQVGEKTFNEHWRHVTNTDGTARTLTDQTRTDRRLWDKLVHNWLTTTNNNHKVQTTHETWQTCFTTLHTLITSHDTTNCEPTTTDWLQHDLTIWLMTTTYWQLPFDSQTFWFTDQNTTSYLIVKLTDPLNTLLLI